MAVTDYDPRTTTGIPTEPVGSLPRVESPEEVRDALVRAANFIPKERLGSTDDCGFSPFSIDEKPNHGSPDYARDVAFQKIANRVTGTRLAAEKPGIS
jgi:methionine synthase II (cobalamin-independent)